MHRHVRSLQPCSHSPLFDTTSVLCRHFLPSPLTAVLSSTDDHVSYHPRITPTVQSLIHHRGCQWLTHPWRLWPAINDRLSSWNRLSKSFYRLNWTDRMGQIQCMDGCKLLNLVLMSSGESTNQQLRQSLLSFRLDEDKYGGKYDCYECVKKRHQKRKCD